jgi:hypothetical protein
MNEAVFDLLENSNGVIVGRVMTYHRPLNKKERAFCTAFVETISKGRKEVETVSDDMKCNVVALAGEVKKVHVEKQRGLLMIECGPESNRNKWLRCTVFDDEPLAKKLSGFMEGDYIRVKGHVRVWSRKKEGSSDEWEQNTEIRIEEIKGDPPKRAAKPAAKTSKAFEGDDGLPW